MNARSSELRSIQGELVIFFFKNCQISCGFRTRRVTRRRRYTCSAKAERFTCVKHEYSVKISILRDCDSNNSRSFPRKSKKNKKLYKLRRKFRSKAAAKGRNNPKNNNTTSTKSCRDRGITLMLYVNSQK